MKLLLSLLGLSSLLVSSSAVEAVTTVTPGSQPFSVYVGYADDVRVDPGFPNPWLDSSSPNVVKMTPEFPQYDCGAIRIDPLGTAVVVTNVDLSFPGPATFGPFTDGLTTPWDPKIDYVPGNIGFGLWHPSFPQTIPAGHSGILAQTNEFDLDTSDVVYFRGVDCSAQGTADFISNNGALWASSAPTVTITYQLPSDATEYQVTFKDSSHILDTGGFDFASCRNENHDWVPIGTGSVFEGVGSIVLANATPYCGQQYTFTAHAFNPDGSNKAQTLVNFWIDNVVQTQTCHTDVTGTCSVHMYISGGSHNVQVSYGDYANNAAVKSPAQTESFAVIAGGCGDPSFFGFVGQSFQVHGTSGAVYNVISTPSLQYNALFTFLDSGRCRKGTQCFAHPGNYFGEVGILLNNGKGVSKVDIVSGAVDAGLTLSIDGAAVTSAAPVQVGSANVTLASPFEVLVDTEEFNFRIQNSDFFLNQDVSMSSALASKIAAYKRAMKSGVAASTAELPHGILGQTWNSVQYSNRWKHIEGQLFDYIVNDGIFGTNFNYNRFPAQ